MGINSSSKARSLWKLRGGHHDALGSASGKYCSAPSKAHLSSRVSNEPFKSQLLLELITNRRQGKLICT